LTDKASYRPEEIQFSWSPMPYAAGVAACELVVEGFDMLAFDDKAASTACLRNKSIVFVGDSVTRCVLGVDSYEGDVNRINKTNADSFFAHYTSTHEKDINILI